MSEPSTAAQISQLFRAIEIQQQAKLNQALMAKFGVTTQQAITIGFIGKHPGLIQKDVVDVMHRRAATVSTFLKKLEEAGFIRREIPANNSRNKQIYLTKSGEAVATFFQQQREQAQSELVEGLTVGQQSELLQLLQLVQNGNSPEQ